MNILFAGELQRRLDAEGSPITVITLHPGAVATGTLATLLSNPTPVSADIDN